MKPTEIEIPILGLNLTALAWGPEDGIPVLGLHGWLDNASTFDRLAPLLNPKIRLVSIDLPGHGLSDQRAAGVQYHFVDWVADIFAAADALGWKEFSLLAHSMGAGIATLVAGTCPERIHRTVLLEGLGPLTAEADQTPLLLERGVKHRAKFHEREPMLYPDIESAAQRLKEANPTLSDIAVEILSARGTKEVESGVQWRHDPRLRGTSVRLTEEQALAFVRRIVCPVLIFWAEEGWPFDHKLIEKRAKAFADAEIVRVKGAHHVHLDAPERVAERVSSFLSVPHSSE
jgi:pimeloyl-ACP methyl ester carboxylesterase